MLTDLDINILHHCIGNGEAHCIITGCFDSDAMNMCQMRVHYAVQQVTKHTIIAIPKV